MKNWKDNISFILVEPKESGNVGASARAIKNMGFKNLEIVGQRDIINNEACWMACNAHDILEKVCFHDNLKSAIRDKGLVVGTTRRLGKKRGLILPLMDGINRIRNIAVNNNVAILFGREDRGLFNKEVEECGFLITIPSDSSSPSLNLAQSVLLVAYELRREEAKELSEVPVFVSHKDLDMLYDRLKKALKDLEYIPQGNRDLEKKIMNNLKHLIGRAGLSDWELRMLHGICSQIEKKLKATSG